MSNAVKNIVSVAAALGLIYSMFAGACVGAADSFAENSDISKIKAVSAERINHTANIAPPILSLNLLLQVLI